MAKPQILVVGGADAAEAVAGAGFPLAGDDGLRRQTAAAIIDARGDAGPRAQGLVRSLRAALGPRAGLFFAWVEPGTSFEPGEFDGVFPADASPAFLAARLESALRMAAMADEARLRFETLARFGGAARPPALSGEGTMRILVHGEPGRSSLSVMAALEGVGAQVVAAISSFTAFDYLHEGSFDGVAVLAGTDMASARSFCSALRRNARLFHLPCVVFADPDSLDLGTVVERGASDAVVAGLDDPAAVVRLISLCEEKRRRDGLALAFAAARCPAAIDPTTGLYGQAFFEAHLARLVARAEETDRPLAIATVAVDATSPQTGPLSGRSLDRVIGQVGAMMARLVRAEDVAASLDRNCFAVAFPASELQAAETAARRLAAVLECTAYDYGDAAESAQVSLSVSCAAFMSGERPSALLGRSLAGLGLRISGPAW